LQHSSQSISEDKKKPDFIFPSEEAYKSWEFDSNKLTFLAAKTTCKDRWRQILNEADRIKIKHLFTLQQGISTNQLKEMQSYNVQLVVPKQYIKSYPTPFQPFILPLESFVHQLLLKQS
jgi:type II restriction enzyme